MILFCDFTNMTVLSMPAPERLNDDHIPGINHVDGKPSLDIVLSYFGYRGLITFARLDLKA